MQLQKFLPALALFASLVATQSSDNVDMPIVSAFLQYANGEGISSLSAEGLTAQASLYGSLVDSIESVLSTAAPSEKSYVESYVSSAVFADPTLSSVVASITSEYGGGDSTPAATAGDNSASATSSSDSEGGAAAVDARYMGLASTAAGVVAFALAVFL